MHKEITYNISDEWVNSNMDLLNINTDAERTRFLKIVDALGNTIKSQSTKHYLLNEKGGTSPVFPKSIFAVSVKKNKDKKYISTIGYKPSTDSSIIIPQIQGIKGQNLPLNWVELNLEGALNFFSSFGYTKVIIPDATSIDGYFNPKAIPLDYDISKHRARLTKIYNKIPEEKIGFKYDPTTNTRFLNI